MSELDSRSRTAHVRNAIWRLVIASITWAAVPCYASGEGKPCGIEPTDMYIEYGEVISCSLEPTGDTDLFRFVGVPGETIIAQVITIDAPNVLLQLFDPAGKLVGRFNSGNGVATIWTTLAGSGSYGLLVSNGTLRYVLDLERVAPTPSLNAIPLCQGCLLDHQHLDPRGDVDLFSFAGLKGGTATVEVAALDAIGMLLEVYAPDGKSIGRMNSGLATATVTAPLPLTGIYTIRLSGPAMTYNISFHCLSCAPATEPACHLSLTPGTDAVTVGFVLGSRQPTTSNLWVTSDNTMTLLWSKPLAPSNAPSVFEVRVPWPGRGRLGVLTTLVDVEGIVCADFETADRGQP